jgi:8-oxo-dGTP pyrophosphatase MutT (NUDIX family)
MNGLMRHIEAANNVTAHDGWGGRLAFLIGDRPVGRVLPAFALVLAASGCRAGAAGVVLEAGAALPALAWRLAEAGHFRWRGEAFDVRAEGDWAGPVLSTIDRGALPLFGIAAQGVHVNGLVQRADGLHLWVARRSAAKALDPGKLDHLVAGGIGAGMSALETVVKEAWEEAGMAPGLAARACPAAFIGYDMVREEGLRRDRLHCFDLDVPEDFQPVARDGEVEAFVLWPMGEVLAVMRSSNDFKFNVNLVLIDLMMRKGFIDEAGSEGRRLRAALTGSPATVT